MKKLTAIVLLVVLTLSLVSCGEQTESSPSASTEPPVSAAPSDIPSVEPSTPTSGGTSIEPSTEPSELPANDIDAYWEERVLTSDSGDLMMDAARWVRDYYRSYYTATSPYIRQYAKIVAAQIIDLRDDGFTLYTECYLAGGSGGGRFVDDHATEVNSSGWYLRTIYFDFEEVDGGYHYAGISASASITLDCTMSTTVVRDGVESAGLENDVRQLETLLGYIANGETLDELPSDVEYIGSLSYSYADTVAEWEFYNFKKVIDEWNSYECVAARSVDTGEVVDTDEKPMFFYLDMPSRQEICDFVDSQLGTHFILGTGDGCYFTTPEEVQAVRDALITMIWQGGIGLSNSLRDSSIFSNDDISLNGVVLCFEGGWENNGSLLQLRMYVDNARYYWFFIDAADNVYTEIQNFMQNKMDTLRDGTFLSEVVDWEVVTPTEETELLSRAYDLFGIYDMSSIMLSNDDPPEDAVPIIIDSLYYYDMSYLYDPTADGYLAHIASYADFVEYTHSVFCDELADYLIGNGVSYFEGPNGELYGGGFGRGGMNLSVGKTLAYYKFEPAEDILVVRKIHERYTSHDGWQTEEYVGEGAWDTVFVKEDGMWKVKYISYEV